MLCAKRTGCEDEFWIEKIHSIDPTEDVEEPIKVRWFEMNEEEEWFPYESDSKKKKYGKIALGSILHHNFSFTSKNKLPANTRKKIEKILLKEKKTALNVI